jgi:hypothetical protein
VDRPQHLEILGDAGPQDDALPFKDHVMSHGR